MRVLAQCAGMALALASAMAVSTTPVYINTSAVLAQTHPTSFLSFSFDTTALFGVQRTAIPFSNPDLAKMAAHLAPAYVRIGGSFEDNTAYNLTGDLLQPLPWPINMTQLYLNESKWNEVVNFCNGSALDMVFGLNAAIGRQSTDPHAPLAWNTSNIQQLLSYIAEHGQHVPVFELGNEVNVFNCSGLGNRANMSAADFAGQYKLLAEMVADTLPMAQIWGTDSSITGDVKGQCHSWYGDDLFGFNRDWLSDPAQPATVTSALTWHWYPQCAINATCDAQCLTQQMLSYEYLTRMWPYESTMRALRDSYAPGKPLIMGETASYWAGGVANASNRYVSGFWYLQQSGYLAARGYWVQIRQDIAGGDYGLLDLVQPNGDPNGPVAGFLPNPDYWTSILWKMLVGPRVLRTNALDGDPESSGVWGWAFCTAAHAPGAAPGDVTLIISNLNTAPVDVQTVMSGGAGGNAAVTRAEYLLLPPAGADPLLSQDVCLNHAPAPLRLQPDLSLPPLPATLADGSTAVHMPPLSYGFYHLRGAGVAACM